MDTMLRNFVRGRARDRCEYCGIRQDEAPVARFQIEHIIARQHGGADESENLALACNRCNLHKGPNVAGIDPVSGAIVPLFHPRRQAWSDHFTEHGGLVAGLTAIGRVTVELLQMNAPERVELRAARHRRDDLGQ